MNSSPFFKKAATLTLLTGLLMGLVSLAPRSGPLATRLNVVLIVADDLGWADLGCYGNTFNETPALDRLARRGTRFTQAYATCPVCSPSRASLMTGRLPATLDLTDWLPGRKQQTGVSPGDKLRMPDTRQQLPLEATTLAEVLQKAGYATGLFGKWHLGGAAFFPEKQGFDVAAGKPHGGSPLHYFYPYRNGTQQSADLTPTGQPGEYLTDRLTDEAVNFMAENQDKPFFVYLAHHAVHIPIQAKPVLIEKYRRKLGSRPAQAPYNPEYAALLESLDQSVGRVMTTLDSLGLTGRTLVLFTSDNGGLSVKEGPLTPATSNAPLREGKGYVYEGGIRVPLLAYLPGQTGRTSEAVVWGADFYPTLLNLLGLKMPNPAEVEGTDVSAVFRGKAPGPRTLFWHYPHYANQGSRPAGAIREGDFKLIEQFEDRTLELYNLRTDPGEHHNLASTQPRRVQALHQKLKKWRERINARMPTPLPG
ncbi:MAG: sulfatase [Cytophagaceae bacterium]|nr:sulfatase [Cytophagaceae bacterium]